MIIAAISAAATLLAGHAGPAAGAQVTRNYAAALPNVPGKAFTAITVRYPPGAGSAPHFHAQSAFIFAYVLSGSIESEVEGSPAKIYSPGESWTEGPGAHHLICRNASATEAASMVVVIVSNPESPISSPVPVK